MRGFACVGLDQPKIAENIGGAMRAAHAYGASLVAVAGKRFGNIPADTSKAWRHVPVVSCESVFDVMPRGCVPIAVDLIEGATPLPAFDHPERAFYIFGGEDRTLGPEIVDRCQEVIYVPTTICMNLAAAVNVVLYDRMAKAMARQGVKA